MKNPAITDFIVSKEAKTITVERSFAAELDTVWSAWTQADILCKWWAPKPYACVIKSLDFRAGGRWIYCMQGPQGDKHWAFFDYDAVRPKSFYSGTDGFCDEQGTINAAMPRTKWESSFSEANGSTLVRCILHFTSAEAMDTMIKMGFKEGFTMGLDQLDELLVNNLV